MNIWRDVARDARQALRRLRQWRGMAGVALGTLALTLGVGVSVFSAFNGLVLNPLPFGNANRLLWIGTVTQNVTGPAVNSGLSVPDFVDYRAQSHQVRYWGAYFPGSATLLGQGPPQHVNFASVTAEFFDALQVQPSLGRSFQRSDEVPSIPQTVVLGAGIWKSRFGGDRSIVGRGINLDGRLMTVIGVMPAGFSYPTGTEMWVPKSLYGTLRGFRYLSVIGRLAPGASVSSARGEVSAIARRLAMLYPDTNRGQRVQVESLVSIAATPYRATMSLMAIAALLVLGLACANVANLLLVAAVGRSREMALRATLGASRRRIGAQLLTEGSVLAALGGVGGWVLAMAAIMPALRRWHPPSLPQLSDARLDGAALATAALATIVTALWFGLAPAWEMLRPGSSLYRAGAGDSAGRRSRLSSWIVAAEVAITVVVLVGAGMLVNHVGEIERDRPGLDPAHVITFRSSLLYNSPAELRTQAVVFEQLDERLRALPGVEAAGLISELPLAFSGPETHFHFYLVGAAHGPELPDSQRPEANFHRVLPGYFRAMDLGLRGRDFNDEDGGQSERVLILSRSLAEELFPGQPADAALGHFIATGHGHITISRIIGIADDAERVEPEARYDIYGAYPQSPVGEMSVVVRTSGDPWRLLPAFRGQLAQLDAEVPVYAVETLAQRLQAARAPDRFRADLLLAVAALALLLATAGLYGVVAHSVALRRRDIGVRVALGATPLQVRRLVVGESLKLIGYGLAVGFTLALAGQGVLARMVGTAARAGAGTWVMVAVLLLAVGFAASAAPALAAARLDPAATLRSE